ncbi:hypothetical protein SAMN05216559_3574 [Halomicrobium zhouii]|uniref:SsDNA-binding replication factor A, large subunit n=1 Tax=Halomicrobium zhouii TaxID=767519 RepID=A0A1I6M251_9EURY|nr:hypothetical protein SAMN05216559_3574 [Halomicrobium zhouii]
MSSHGSHKKVSVKKHSGVADEQRAPEEQTLQTSVASQVDANGLLNEVAESTHEQELRPSVEQEIQGKKDYDWTRSTDVGPDRRYGETLASQERRLGEAAEMERHREHALAAAEADLERGKSCRVQTQIEQARSARDFWERAHLAAGREHVTIPQSSRTQTVDPRATLSQEELARVNERAESIAASFEALSRADAARRLAEEWDKQGTSFTEAVFTVLNEWADDPTVPINVAGIDPDDRWVTVEGEITWLFDEPATRNQYQVGYLEDDQGTSAKVTVWRRSMYGPMVRTLSEGDRVRIALGKPGEYNGQKTIAVTSDTAIISLDR